MTSAQHPRSTRAWPVIGALVLILSACGSGGDSGSPPTEPTVAKTTFTGTVATGAALAGASVSIKCLVGEGTVTSGDDGTYTVALNDATLPCIASATSTDGNTVLHAVVDPAGGTTQTLNINPLTELVAAKLAGGDPATLQAAFDTAAAARITANSIGSAVDSVVATLKEGGVDFSAVGNPMTAPLVAKTSSTAGNAYDEALDALGARLAAGGTTLSQMTAALTTTGSGVSLRPEQLLQAAAPGCPALRSGTYRLINPVESEAEWRSGTMNLDAATGKVTWQDGSTDTATSLGGCAFSSFGGQTRIVVSQAGFIVFTGTLENGKPVLAYAFPEQKAQLSDLAGTWNVLEFNNVDSAASPLYINEFTVAEIAADGRHVSLLQCDGLQACTPYQEPLGTFRVNAGGGFDYVDPSGQVTDTRFFVYRNAGGTPIMLAVGPDDVLVGSVQTARALPSVGAVSHRWDSSMNPALNAANFSEATYTVNDVDAAAQTYTRTTQANGVVNEFSNNLPRNGLVHRAAGTTTNNSGAIVNVSELISLPLPGTGVVFYGRVTTESTRNSGFFGVGVQKPDDTPTVWPVVTSTVGTLNETGGSSYALRVSLTIDSAGLINGGAYDFHTLAGTMTPCTWSAANTATCFGADNVIDLSSQSGLLTTAGAANPTNLQVGPDSFGYSFNGTITGTIWTGTYTKAATATSVSTGSGVFSVEVSITTR